MEDTNKMVMERGIGKQIVLVPGRCFNANPSQPSPYIRAAFSLASEDEIDQVREARKVSPLIFCSTFKALFRFRVWLDLLI